MGRKIRYHDEFHRVMRERQRKYEAPQKKALALAQLEKIPLEEARKRLGIRFQPKKRRGTRRK